MRLAVIVSHPIQYYVPLYRRLAKRSDLDVKVFFTWHAADGAQQDHGFKREVRWDIPLTEGYEYELMANVARAPGTHHFWGLRNPDLIKRVTEWKPDAVHVTGYALASHLHAMRHFHGKGVPILFRGDSHLLDQKSGIGWQLKRFLLRHLYARVRACLYVGKNNYEYYRRFGVPDSRLFYCPHSIEVERFAEPSQEYEQQARSWRRELEIGEQQRVALFAGKFEAKKRPLDLMKAFADLREPGLVRMLVGNGPVEREVSEMAASYPRLFRVLPFQNQSRMPIVYRLADVFVLPSAYNETWGLSVNEAISCGRPVLISDKVGCGADVVDDERLGAIFRDFTACDLGARLREVLARQVDHQFLLGKARHFDIAETERTLLNTLWKVRELPH